MTELEKEVEGYVRRQVEMMDGLFLKWTCPGNAGVPDRIAVLPNGEVWFVEMKAEKGKTRPLQDYWQRELKKRNCKAAVITGMEAAQEWVRERAKEISKWRMWN